jgi:hypothetical protein
MADLFWHRWTKEYLLLLQERQKWTAVKRNLSIGDIVLVVDPTAHNTRGLEGDGV